jgi:4'-phosphopantetheinyl transferase
MLELHPDSDRARLVTLVWSAKESALKALRLGLKADTRRVELRSFTNGQNKCWSGIMVEDHHNGRKFHGWWQEHNDMVMTILSDQERSQPIEL